MRYLPPSPQIQPFQPGAGPSPPLGLPFALGVGLGLLLKGLWDLLNRKNPEIVGVPPPGSFTPVGPGTDVSFQCVYDVTIRSFENKFCPTGGSTGPDTTVTGTQVTPLVGVGISVGATSGTARSVCGNGEDVPGGNVAGLRVRNAAGNESTFFGVPGNSVSFGGVFVGSTERTISNIRTVYLGATSPWESRSREPLAPAVVPVVPAIAAATPEGLPLLPGAPGPAPVTAPPVPGEATPAPSPSTAPGGLPGRAPAPAPAPRPGVAPGPGPAAVPALPAARPITARGPAVLPAPPVTQTAPGTTFLPGGVQLPDNGPPPTMQGVATELGKLERKIEIALAPEGPLSLLQQINRAIDQIENIRFVLDSLFPDRPYEFSAGQYQLMPVCDRDSEGAMLPPRVASWTGGQGEVVEVRRKIDALAQLLQHHKDLRQPTCGGGGSGPSSNVTVHFESD